MTEICGSRRIASRYKLSSVFGQLHRDYLRLIVENSSPYFGGKLQPSRNNRQVSDRASYQA